MRAAFTVEITEAAESVGVAGHPLISTHACLSDTVGRVA
jgi:hypothetical protein